MIFDSRSYSVLIVSASEKFCASLSSVLPDFCTGVRIEKTISAAKRATLEKAYDFVIINSPLPDDFGAEFAIEICLNKNTVAMMFVKSELYEELKAKTVDYGVFILPKPSSAQTIKTAFDWLAASRERLKRFESNNRSIEKRMEEIRTVNHAKWVLIEKMNMNETDAHKFIEKQAMNKCVSRSEIAKGIIETYQ